MPLTGQEIGVIKRSSNIFVTSWKTRSVIRKIQTRQGKNNVIPSVVKRNS